MIYLLDSAIQCLNNPGQLVRLVSRKSQASLSFGLSVMSVNQSVAKYCVCILVNQPAHCWLGQSVSQSIRLVSQSLSQVSQSVSQSVMLVSQSVSQSVRLVSQSVSLEIWFILVISQHLYFYPLNWCNSKNY